MRYFLLLMLLTGAVQAAEPDKTGKVYRWVDDKGVIHYTDKPPSQGAKPAKLPPLQTFKPHRPAATPAAPAAKPKAAVAPSVRILSPAADQTVRSSELAVSASSTPEKAGRYAFYLDGAMVAEATEPSHLLRGLERGSHRIEVAVKAADGRELARSPAVTVHVQQASQVAPKRNPAR